jgi:hypothetical protein
MTRRNTKCRHAAVQAANDRDCMTVSARCEKCGAFGVRGLGPANDASLAVEHEIAAAALAASIKNGDPGRLTNSEADGFAEDESSVWAHITSWHIGWLVAEIVHDHSDGWSWDISRPIAEQLAETALDDAAADALLADLKADQQAIDEALRREAWKANEPVRAAARELFAAADYESARASEPDIRDEDDVEVPPALPVLAVNDLDARFDPEVES